uniref:SFRICE_015503 n=1 Tax=Spodoptera frugiperda TaxID=7108 RepID=A0A2H1V4S1_SPOFR
MFDVSAPIVTRRQTVLKLVQHNAPGCSGGVSHPVLTGLALCPLAARGSRAAVITPRLSCNRAY